jgi:arylsulfatase A-like enzyme
MWKRSTRFLIAFSVALAAATAAIDDARGAERPNVVLVMTDDQGYGDLGCHGNPVLKTPWLDRLYDQSIRLTNFHVDPTCSPTRAALLTGKYSCRTGVWHTILGRSLLRRDELTMADLLSKSGYRTAIFGKWHLGDNYPYRAVDRGFQVSLVHGGGGITQTPDYWGNTYFSPTLYYNGKPVRTKGYCTDVLFAEALRFVETNRARPFLLYIPTNVPHSPYQVADSYSQPYRDAGLPETLARFYGMITNLDENLGRLMQKLDELRLAHNTILIFMTDNGTAGEGFNVRMRGRKGSEYDGGHRVPCFIRWPARFEAGRDIGRLTAHVDLLPTLADLCKVDIPEDLRLDGMSLTPLLLSRGESWPRRTLFVQSHRIDHPQPWRKSAVMSDKYRLVNGEELYDVESDREQRSDIAAEHRDIVKIMRREYQDWYKYVSERFYEYCEVVLGSPEHNPTTLTCHDWHGSSVPWNQGHILQRIEANGFWAVEVERPGRYQITLRERPAWVKHPIATGTARLKIGDVDQVKPIPGGTSGVTFVVELQEGKTQMQTWLLEQSGQVRGAYFVDVNYVGPAE